MDARAPGKGLQRGQRVRRPEGALVVLTNDWVGASPESYFDCELAVLRSNYQ
jgi:hypothetical protein